MLYMTARFSAHVPTSLNKKLRNFIIWHCGATSILPQAPQELPLFSLCYRYQLRPAIHSLPIGWSQIRFALENSSSACLCRPHHRMASHRVLSPGAQGNLTRNQAPAQAKQKLAVVFRKLQGNAILDPIEVSSLDTGQQIFCDLKHRYLELLRSESRAYWLKLLLVRMEIEIAEIRWVNSRYF